MVAIIGGEPHRFRPLIDLYRETALRAGHAPEKLVVGLHSIGYLADRTEQAAEEFFPGYAQMFTEIGKERGWPPTTRAHFDAQRGPTGALLIGDAETIAEKVLYINEALGGIVRLSFQMNVAALPLASRLHAIEILGTRVAPIVRKEVACVSAVTKQISIEADFHSSPINLQTNTKPIGENHDTHPTSGRQRARHGIPLTHDFRRTRTGAQSR